MTRPQARIILVSAAIVFASGIFVLVVSTKSVEQIAGGAIAFLGVLLAAAGSMLKKR
jgi:F0F1-type ATP synthase assembly protein I